MHYKGVLTKSSFYLFDPLGPPSSFEKVKTSIKIYEGKLRKCIHSFIVAKGEVKGFFENQMCIDKYDEVDGVLH